MLLHHAAAAKPLLFYVLRIDTRLKISTHIPDIALDRLRHLRRVSFRVRGAHGVTSSLWLANSIVDGGLRDLLASGSDPHDGYGK